MSKYTLTDLKKYAQKKDGICLSDLYMPNDYFLWQCKYGHRWKAPFDRIKKGHWCPKCAGRNFIIKDMHDFAGSKGGKCLSLKYVGSRKSLKWECFRGHIWNASFYLAQQTWCSECNQIEKNKETLKEMCAIAEERGGKCLSKEYCPDKKLMWECRNGHIWEAVSYKIRFGNWCAICAGVTAFSIEDLRDVAKNRGGRVLSTQYKNAYTKVLWECTHGHQWWARFCDIKNNKSWCPFCAGKKTITDMYERAQNHKGKCLSKEYFNEKIKLEWECEKGHVFWRTPQSVLRGNFCPECSSLESEKFCRKTFRELFDQEFPSLFPEWLRRPDTGSRLQLDGYCESLKIAFEHNGLQHYEVCDFFHMSEKDLLDLKYRDSIKLQKCGEKGIFLIIIPQLGVKINGLYVCRKNLKEFISDELRKKGYNFSVGKE
jgi:hypothetical protein